MEAVAFSIRNFDWAEEMDIGGLLDIEPVQVAARVELK